MNIVYIYNYNYVYIHVIKITAVVNGSKCCHCATTQSETFDVDNDSPIERK